MNAPRHKQRGAALIVVMLIAATLSFVALALVGAVSQSAQRTGGTAARAELLWRAVSAEAIAKAAISEALRQTEGGGPPLTSDHPLFSEQLIIPFPNGAGAMIFADATRCFNLNSLGAAAGSDSDGDESGPRTEFIELMKAIGLGETEASNLASVVRDWIDADSIPEIGGAEDGFYTALPTPYRTGGARLASVSELRAMQGVTPAIYAAASPFLCAAPEDAPMVINLNALTPDHAPLLTALTRGFLDVDAARDMLASRPPGGWTSPEQFWALPAFEDEEFDGETMASRTSVASRYIEARAGATVNEIDMNVRLLFSAPAGTDDPTLISRELNRGA